MKSKDLNFGIIGSGSWGTAIIKIISENIHAINWYVRKNKNVEFIKKNKHNKNYLSSVNLNTKKLKISSNINEVCENSDILIFAVPSKYIESELKKIEIDFSNKIIISAIKGIVPQSNLLFSEHLEKYYEISSSNIAVISGPCHAEEVGMEKLSYLTMASSNVKRFKNISYAFKCKYININMSEDKIGVEYSSMLKNIYALAIGISNGLGYGDNFQSVLMSNSIREMKYLISKRDKKDREINNSVYLGDLLVTGYSAFSRNRMFGNMIGKGYSVRAAQSEMKMVAEGYIATKKAFQLDNKKNRDKTPILNAVYEILYDKKSSRKIFKQLSDKIN